MMMGMAFLKVSWKNKSKRMILKIFCFLPYQDYSIMDQVYSSSDLCLVPQAMKTGSEQSPQRFIE